MLYFRYFRGKNIKLKKSLERESSYPELGLKAVLLHCYISLIGIQKLNVAT